MITATDNLTFEDECEYTREDIVIDNPFGLNLWDVVFYYSVAGMLWTIPFIVWG